MRCRRDDPDVVISARRHATPFPEDVAAAIRPGVARTGCRIVFGAPQHSLGNLGVIGAFPTGCAVSDWQEGLRVPDALQRTIALVAAILTAPMVVALGVAVRLDSPGPALYRASRLGAGGSVFECLKLRTMRLGADLSGPPITTADDTRVTRLGRLLRGFRLDELPQLWNVVRGEMRLVGPRPEDPQFYDPGNERHRLVFSTRPGITGPTQLAFLHEAELLDPADPVGSYRSLVLPRKLELDAAYLATRSTLGDLRILGATLARMLRRSPGDARVTRSKTHGADGRR